MQILDGVLVSAHIKEQIKQEVTDWQAKGGKKPHLAAVLVGNNPASEAYVGSKVKHCEELGFDSTLLRFESESITEAATDTCWQVERDWNNDDVIDGILVQLPLPAHISGDSVINAISPAKDVDGFHPISQGKMMLGCSLTFLPATPYGIMLMLEYYKIDTEAHALRGHWQEQYDEGTPMTNTDEQEQQSRECHSYHVSFTDKEPERFYAEC